MILRFKLHSLFMETSLFTKNLILDQLDLGQTVSVCVGAPLHLLLPLLACRKLQPHRRLQSDECERRRADGGMDREGGRERLIDQDQLGETSEWKRGSISREGVRVCVCVAGFWCQKVLLSPHSDILTLK